MQKDFDASTLEVKSVTSEDWKAVHDLLVRAFPTELEAQLVSKLRHCGVLVLELVAISSDGDILGHAAFSRVTVADVGPGRNLSIACLAPVSVTPVCQRNGVGSRLIRAGIDALTEAGEDLVLVLGPPDYFRRFGFDPEIARKVSGPYAGNAFQALALTQAGASDLHLEVVFATPFEELE